MHTSDRNLIKHLLLTGNGIVFPRENGKLVLGRKDFIAFNINMSSYGYMFDDSVFEKFINGFNTKQELKSFYHDIISILSTIKGVVYAKPLFKNFPTIPDEDEYFVQRIISYLDNMYILFQDKNVKEDDNYITIENCGHVINKKIFNINDYNACPICQMQSMELISPIICNFGLEHSNKINTLFYCNKNIDEILKKIVESPVGMTKNEDNLLNYVLTNNDIDNKKNVQDILNTLLSCNIKHKSIKNMLAVFAYKKNINLYDSFFDNIVDILRFANLLQLKPYNNINKIKKFNLNNKARKYILHIINNIKKEKYDDAKTYAYSFVKLGECLHPGKYKNKYRNAYIFFDIIRNNTKILQSSNSKEHVTYNILKSNNISNDNIRKSIKLLSLKPGSFCRKLCSLLSISDNVAVETLYRFEKIVEKVPTHLLVNLLGYLNEYVNIEHRIYITKNASLKTIESPLKDIKDKYIDMCKNIITNNLLIKFKRHSLFKNINHVCINDTLKHIVIPKSVSKSSSGFYIPRGSQYKISDDTKFIRMFVYWKEKDERVDVDLSAVIFDQKYKKISHLSYTSFRSFGQSCHSGDLQNAPYGAVEYIDIDIDAMLKKKIRYVSCNVFSYNNIPFKNFDCYTGIMNLKNNINGNKETNKHFDPAAVLFKSDVCNDAKNYKPCVIDLEKREVIWIDIYEKNTKNHTHNVENSLQDIKNACKYANQTKKTSLSIYELLILYCNANNITYDTTFDTEKKYDIIFDENFALNAALLNQLLD